MAFMTATILMMAIHTVPETLAHASLSASYNAAAAPWNIYIQNNGWEYPYIGGTRTWFDLS